MTCSLCGTRKAKRACPAVGHDICPVCCGTKRIVQLACPPTCVYLAAADRHPAAVVRRQQERDLSVLVGALGQVSEAQLQLFFVLQSSILRFESPGAPLCDADVAEACGALAASLETASRGLLYEQQASSPTAEALRRDLAEMLARLGRQQGARFEREAAEVLRGIERGASHQAAGIGDGSVDYLTLAARILQERPPDASRASSRIILP